MKNKKINIIIGVFVIGWIIVSVVGVVLLWKVYQNEEEVYYSESGDFAFEKFDSLTDMKEYLSNVEQDMYYREDMLVGDMVMPVAAKNGDMASVSNESTGTQSRSSDTYVQVVGIDEADKVKTDGKYIYLATTPDYSNYIDTPLIMDEVDIIDNDIMPIVDNIKLIDKVKMPIHEQKASIAVINTLPVDELKKITDIEGDGDLLLIDNYLVLIGDDTVEAFDISDIEEINSAWKIELEENNYIVDIRLIGEQIYLVTGTYLYDYGCEIPLYQNIAHTTSIQCTDIYYPLDADVSEQVFTVSKIESKTGEVNETVSFLGTFGSTVIYMSYENIYVTYSSREWQSEYNIAVKLVTDGQFDSILPDNIINDLKRIINYDISETSKQNEIGIIMDKYIDGLEYEEKEILEEQMGEVLENYMKEHKRDFSMTGIVKIRNTDLALRSTTKIPGYLLNSFSMDEYNGNLRVATTTDANLSTDSFNDLYILDEKLKEIGSILDYGEDERIYAVRYMGEKAYVVTYRETDPLYIMDLSDSKDPKITGELKIPGYSSFLHELSDGLLLGVGKEGRKVKISLFDTSDITKPQEVDMILLDESWSDLVSDHHAFLVDEKHKVFVIPAGDKAYIVDYSDDKELKIVLKVTNIQATRSLYIDDYIYIIANTEIKVVDENTWEVVKRFEIK